MASVANPAFRDRFLTFINPYLRAYPVRGEAATADPAGGILLAVSGGLDSVVMAHLFQTAGFRFAIAHVNFGLRGEESDGDARFVEQLATHYKVPVYLTRFATNEFADATGVSVQMAARTLRYEWFEQIRNQQGYQYIATAHHRNDVLETLLLNLTRGTGLAGLHGIPVRQGYLLRPLLFADRADLETYATDQQLIWREDRSNAHDHYARNRIRHHVVPQLQTINPNLLQTLGATLDRLRAAETLMQYELDRTAELVVKSTDKVTQIDLILLRKLSEPLFRLAEWLRPFGYSYQQTTAIWETSGQGMGQEFWSATHRLIHERDHLTLLPVSPSVTPADEPVLLTELPEGAIAVSPVQGLTFRLVDKTAGFVPSPDPNLASLDGDRLTFPLTIRRWQAGDRFRPLGLKGHKLVSDMLADLKIPRLLREQTRVLLSGNQIAWVVGQRIDHRFRITASTRRVCHIQHLER